MNEQHTEKPISNYALSPEGVANKWLNLRLKLRMETELKSATVTVTEGGPDYTAIFKYVSKKGAGKC